MSGLRLLCESNNPEDIASEAQHIAPSEERGFTTAVLDALKAAGEPLRPTEVRNKLTATGYDLKGYQNPLASIHIILKRLVKAGNARAAATTTDHKTYEWIDPTSAPTEVQVVTAKKTRTRKKG
jgi:hypothetical protein